MKRIKKLLSSGKTGKRRVLGLLSALSILATGSGQAAAQLAPPDPIKAPPPRYSQTLEVTTGDRLFIKPEHGSHGPGEGYCDKINQTFLRYYFLVNGGDSELRLVCAHVKLGDTAATPEFVEYIEDLHTDDGGYVDLAPVDTVFTRASFTYEYFKPTITLGVSHLTLNGKQLIIRPDAEWIHESTCEGTGKIMIGRRNIGSLCATVIAANEPQPATGSVIISHWHTNLPCTFAVPTGPVAQRHYHGLAYEEGVEDKDKPWGPCTANTAAAIEFEQLPSATRILLTDDPGCQAVPWHGKNSFWIELRTTAKNVSVDAMPFDEILTYQPGSIIRPGVQLVGSYLEKGTTAQRNLGCIMVTTSAAPPVS